MKAEKEEEEEDGDVAVGILKIKGVTKKRKKRLWLKWPCLLLFISHYESVFFLYGIFTPHSLQTTKVITRTW